MFRCGYVAVLGRPNAGKSTLVNSLVGQKVAIVSSKPQTTRNNILGILTENDFQIVFLDTPGVHHSKNKLDHFMMKNVRSAISTADVILYLIDGNKKVDDEEREYIGMLSSKCEKLLIVQTKLDKNREKNNLADIGVSALTGENIQMLKDEIVKLLPAGVPLYDADLFTDKSVSFLIAESLREQLLNCLNDEVPHGVAVVIERFCEEENLVSIDAVIYCENERHKGIIIGKGGQNLKVIGQHVRKYAEDLLGKHVVLKTFVRTSDNWRNGNIDNFGYKLK